MTCSPRRKQADRRRSVMKRRCGDDRGVKVVGRQVVDIAQDRLHAVAMRQLAGPLLVPIDERRQLDPLVPRQDRQVHLLGDRAAADEGQAQGLRLGAS
jgi:hypothetical protein